LISSYPSFLSENANRFFPFLEHNETNLLPNSCFLDFRGWSRLKQVDSPRLTLIYSGATGSTPPPGYSSKIEIKSNHIHLFFELHDNTSSDIADRTICMYIPLNNTVWPFVCTQNYYIQNKIKVFEIRCLVSENILNIFTQNDIINFANGGLKIEPSLYMSCGGVSVDQLNIKDQDGNIKRVLTGKLNFLPGVNTEAKTIDSSIFISAYPGYGNGNDIYTGSSLGICNEIISSINGATPNENGQIFIKGDDYIKVIDDKINNKIILAISPRSKAFKCPS
jgi:hypothetical protein